MDTLKITPEQVDTIFASKAGEDTDYSFKQGFYAAQGAARIQIAALAGWSTVAGPRSFDELAADAKAGWSDEALALYDAASQSFKEEAKTINPLPRVPVDQSFLHAVIQSLTEAGDVSLAETARAFLDSAPRDGFSTVEETIEHGLRGGAEGRVGDSSWQYAWRSFFPEIDRAGKPIPGTFGEEYEWLDFENFGDALSSAARAQDEEVQGDLEDEAQRLSYSVWKRGQYRAGDWEPVADGEEAITDDSVEYGWRAFLPNRDEDGNLFDGIGGEEYEWFATASLEEAHAQAERFQVEENEICKARGLAPLSYSVWKRTPERFGDWIFMASIERETD